MFNNAIVLNGACITSPFYNKETNKLIGWKYDISKELNYFLKDRATYS